MPKEAEWEVACRAETRTMYGQGADVELLLHYAWYVENSGNHVHRPKTRRPGLRGLFDMHGNLWEWAHDWHSAHSTEGVLDATGPDTGSFRVFRGGSWGFSAAGCRSWDRSGDVPTRRSIDLGFRLALVPSGNDAERQEESKTRSGGPEGAERSRDRRCRSGGRQR